MPLYLRTMLTTAAPEAVAEAARRRSACLEDLRDRGRIVAEGELADGAGWFDVVDFADRREAEDVTRGDPLVVAGVVSWMLRPVSDFRARAGGQTGKS